MRFRAPVHVDDRGRLLVVEHRSLDYSPARVFVVTGVPTGVSRGNHVVPCRQTMVLVAGGADVTVRTVLGAERQERLDAPGDATALAPGEYVRYTMDDPASTIMVLAEEDYRGATNREVAS
jgi:hypothetical protein